MEEGRGNLGERGTKSALSLILLVPGEGWGMRKGKGRKGERHTAVWDKNRGTNLNTLFFSLHDKKKTKKNKDRKKRNEEEERNEREVIVA